MLLTKVLVCQVWHYILVVVIFKDKKAALALNKRAIKVGVSDRGKIEMPVQSVVQVFKPRFPNSWSETAWLVFFNMQCSLFQISSVKRHPCHFKEQLVFDLQSSHFGKILISYLTNS
jgi:hypothetical protein